MGRELRRVPMNFDWPLHTVWKGFANPFYTAKECKSCEGTGYSKDAKRWLDLWYGNIDFKPEWTGSTPFGPNHPIVRALAERNVEACKKDGWNLGTVEQEAQRLSRECFDNKWLHHLSQEDVDALIAEERLWDFTHTWTKGKGWEPKDPMPVVTAAMVNEWSLSGMSHDGCSSGVCIEARCKKDGKPYLCSKCEGNGHIWPSPEDEKRYADWESTQPPKGEGYQLWETVTAGSPITPVFATPEDLADWLVENDNSVTKGTTREGWIKFIKDHGWAISTIFENNVVKTGVQALVGE